MKNPDLTPLNGLDVGLKAHNTGYLRSAFASRPTAHLPCGQTSYTPGTLYEILERREFGTRRPGS